MEIIGASPRKMFWCHSNRNFLNNFRINSSSNKKRIFRSNYKQDSRTNCIKTQKMPRTPEENLNNKFEATYAATLEDNVEETSGNNC